MVALWVYSYSLRFVRYLRNSRAIYRSTLALSYSLETIHSAKAKNPESKGSSYRLGCLSYLLTLRYRWKSRRCVDRSMVGGKSGLSLRGAKFPE